MADLPEIKKNPRNKKVLSECARIHVELIPDGFLSTLGEYFLTQLYDYLASNQRSFLLVAQEDNTVLGFICGSYGTGSLYRGFALRKAVLIGFPLLLRLFKTGVLSRLIEVVRYPAGEVHQDAPGSEILNFCVVKDYQGKGIGGLLFEAMCSEYRDQGIEKIRIVTGSQQLSAQQFYEAKGARLLTGLQIHGGHDSLMYTYSIEQ